MCWVSCPVLGLRCGILYSLNFSPYIDIVLICFHILVLQEYGVLTESRIPLKPVLEGCELLHVPLVLMNRLNKTASAVF